LAGRRFVFVKKTEKTCGIDEQKKDFSILRKGGSFGSGPKNRLLFNGNWD
jgi:hypothetical protein